MPSTVIANFFYDAETSTLRVVFRSGKIYEYKDVPESIYHAMKMSFSKGTYFNRHIKNTFAFEKVDR